MLNFRDKMPVWICVKSKSLISDLLILRRKASFKNFFKKVPLGNPPEIVSHHDMFRDKELSFSCSRWICPVSITYWLWLTWHAEPQRGLSEQSSRKKKKWIKVEWQTEITQWRTAGKKKMRPGCLLGVFNTAHEIQLNSIQELHTWGSIDTDKYNL